MRVNIITQPLFINYGGILQNYALQEVIRRLGHEPLTINVPLDPLRKVEWKDYLISLRNLIDKIQGFYSHPFLNPHTIALKQRELSVPQKEFIKKYINKKDTKAPFTSKMMAECPADLWIVGSDQVWRPWCNKYIENGFFDFLDDKVDRIAYSASFGTDQWEIPADKTPYIKNLVKKFKAISVREKSGVKLCKDYLNVEALHLLDPTMLLSGGDYLALTSEDDYPKGKYIATYILDNSRKKHQIIQAERKTKSLPIEKIGIMHKDGFDTIESWLATIANAEYVITDSFHGTVFALIFKRYVKVLGNDLRGNSRLQSLFDLLNLTPDSDGYVHLNDEASERLNIMREKSLNFLKKSLTING